MFFICFRGRKPLHQRTPKQTSEYNGQNELHVTDSTAATDINDLWVTYESQLAFPSAGLGLKLVF